MKAYHLTSNGMQTTNTARNFVLQLGSLIALYISLSAIIAVVFGIITVVFPDAAAGYYEGEGARGAIRFGIAMIIVFFPTYILLTRTVNQIRRNETGTYLTLTKWLIYLSLLGGGGILLGDLVAVIMTFLNGELTVRFGLKALTLLTVIGIAFSYYTLDVKGYWNKHEKKSQLFALSASIIAIIVVIMGYLHIETPAEVREMKLDEQQITDLQNIQSRVYEYYTREGVLPASIAEAYRDLPIPEAPENRPEYEYNRLGDQSFELCAVFAHPSRGYAYSMRPVVYEKEALIGAYDFEHGEGEVCFERKINPVE